MNAPLSTHEEYLDSLQPQARVLIEQIQSKVEEVVPEAKRCVGYNMPAYRTSKTFFYFAAFKNHIGIYPPVSDDIELIEATRPFRGPKGNLSFPSSKPLPIELIGRVAAALAKQYRAK